MNYLCNKKVFATLKEASGYAEEIRIKTRYILNVEQTTRKVTHIYNINK